MKHRWVLAALAAPIVLATLIAGGAHAHDIGDHPDLVVKNLTTEPAPPTPGDEVTVTATVVNEGGAEANDFEYSFGLDGEDHGDTQTWGDDDDESNLGAGDEVTLNATTTWSVTVGEHTTNASVTHQDGISTEEHATDNNEETRPYTIGADLVATDVSVDPSDPIEGDAVTLTATVENQAGSDDTAAVADSFEVTFQLDGEQVSTPVTVDELAPGGTEEVTRTWTASDPGQHTVSAVADEDEQVDDRDRSNNDAGPVTVDVRAALPDLVVSDLTFQPDPARPGQTVTFTAQLGNNGHADAGGHQVALLVDGEVVATTDVDGVAENGQANVTLEWQATAGNHDIEVQVDAGGDQTETNEDNNAWTLSLPVGPDLVVRELAIQPSEPRASDRVRFTLEIGNEGVGVQDPFRVSFDVDGEPIDTVDVPGLGAGEVRNVTSNPWNASVGDHNITAIIDPANSIGEVDEENNARGRQLTVGEPQPDVAVLSASIDPSAPDAGDEVTVRAQLENAGPRDAGAFTVAASVDGDELAETRVDGLAAGEQTTLDLANWTATEGPHELVVRADTGSEIEEIDEANNEHVRSFGVGLDLGVVDLSLSPADPEPGSNVTALAIVQNNGTRATPAANVSFRLEGNEVAATTLGELEPNEQSSVEATFTASLSGRLEVHVDADDAIDEFDEDNNALGASLELSGDTAPPDLTVRSVTVQGDITSGESVRLDAIVANVGEGPSQRALVDFRVDGSSIGPPVSVDGIAAGGETNVTSEEWTPSRSEHEVEVTVDVDEQVDESDETNNTHTRTLEGAPAGIPIGPALPVIALLAAGSVLATLGGNKRKPPKR